MKLSPLTNLKKTIVSAAAASMLMATAVSADCTYQLFTISSKKGTTVNEFIDQLSDACSYTVLVADEEAEKVLNKKLNKTRIKNLTIDEVLQLVLIENNLNYTLENNVLKVSFIETKTFNIDYILTQRRGVGSTDIITSKQAGSEGITAGGTGTTSTQTSVERDDQGNILRGAGETGITIMSSDEVKFWEELDLELQRVLNRPEDNYQADAPIINKNSGMITVSATVQQIRRLEKYLEDLQKKVQYQVLIDVNLLSVTLNDESSKGINWSQLYALQNMDLSLDVFDARGTGGTYEPIGNILTSNSNHTRIFQFTTGGPLEEVIKFLDTQGDVKAISNPKVLTLNNQPALITAGTEYFYSLTSTLNLQNVGGATQTQDVTINSVFAGVLLDITPEISHDGEITLKVNPSITQARSKLSDDNTDRSMPPDLDRRQLSSVVTVKDGERVILGGLINTKNDKDANQIPLLGDIPILGWAFKWEENKKTTEELVIIIEPHIVKPGGESTSLTDLGYTSMTDTDIKQGNFTSEEKKEANE